MTGLPTPREVAVQLAGIGRDLDHKTAEIAALDEEAVRARVAFEKEYARAFINADGAMDVRKQLAVLATEVHKLEAELADVKLRAAKEAIRTLRDRLDIGRSLNAAVRSEWENTGGGK